MTDTSYNPAAPPAAPPPSYDEVQAMSGGTPGYPGQPGAYPGQPGGYQGQPGAYAPYPPQEGFKYDGGPPYPAQPAYPGYPAQPGQAPYPTQPGAPYPYGAPAPGVYPPPPPGTAVYNPQGGVTILNRPNDDLSAAESQRRMRKIIVFFGTFVALIMVFYFLGKLLF
ncbi:galectin-3-like isoform X1 [Mercenaria mercenaria]|uniref:galectin-3-like isoform X1 n=1 Tax=Mercenaria mercenaria TaxID=6596 RepID=UPI001E1DD7E0|nr:galectin-3-like isoform X1 [Mercenaria mercenaria]